MQIIRTTAKLPPIIVIHGQPGVGKTTLGQTFPKPVFVQTEDGCPSGLEIETFGLCETFTSVVQAITLLEQCDVLVVRHGSHPESLRRTMRCRW